MPPAGNASCPLELRKKAEGRCPQARTLREARIGFAGAAGRGIFDRGPVRPGKLVTKAESPF
jgi:hypothetical protein